MKKITLLLAMLILNMSMGFAQSFDVLVFSKTTAYRHSAAIDAGNTMFSTIASNNGWNIDFTENSTDFTKGNLSQYDAVIWNNVSGNVLNVSEKDAFKSYINDGGGYVGIHNAANAETDWPWYVGLLGGATFRDHAGGINQIQSVSIDLESTTNSITSHFESTFTRTDEWYNFTSTPKAYVDRLLSIDESTLAGPNMGGDHPITWKHEYDGGRAFYTGFGHTESSFSEPDVITMFTEAVKWVAKDNKTLIVDEFNGVIEPGTWVIQAPYNNNGGSFPFTTTKEEIEITGVDPGPNQHLVREGVTINPSLPYTVETKFTILNYGGVRSFAVNFLQANQPASQPLNAWSLNLDLAGPIIKYMGFVNGSFDAIGSRTARWAVKNQEYIYKIEVNRRLNGDVSPKWVTATISKPDGTIMDNFEVDYSKFRWQPILNEPVKFGLNSHFASWIASDLKVFYTGKTPPIKETPAEEEPQLIGYWPFDGDADDVAGNNHGIEYNNPSYPTAHIKSGLEANGAYTSVDSDPFDLSKFTLMAWIKPDNVLGTYRVILEKDKLKSDWYGLYQVGNKIHLRWSMSGYTTATSITLEPNVFTHVAATFDGSSARIYINGVLQHSALGSPSKPSTTKGELRFGISGVGTEEFEGLIDEAKIFGTALNQSKIQLEMESSSSSGSGGSSPDPVVPPAEISVTGITVLSESIKLNIGDMTTLTATVSPSTTSNKNIIWSSANPSVAYVNTSGVLTGVANGTTNITVTTVDGGYIDTATVVVSTPAVIPPVPASPPEEESDINLISVSYQIASLKILSWSQIRDNAVRSTANARLAQAKNYFNIAISNFKRKNRKGRDSYLKISTSSIKQFISTLEKGIKEKKLTESDALLLLNEANSINANISFLIDGEFPVVAKPAPVQKPAPSAPTVDPDTTLVSISYQIASLKILSWSQIRDYAVRSTANARLAQAKNYSNIAISNFKRKNRNGRDKYLKISTSSIKQFISTLEIGINKSKITESDALPLINEANSINANINYLIDR